MSDKLGEARKELAGYEGEEGRCPVGHNKRLTYEMRVAGEEDGTIGCVACERDAALTQLAAATREAERLREALEPFAGVAGTLPKRMDEDATLAGLPEISVADWVRAYLAFENAGLTAAPGGKEE